MSDFVPEWARRAVGRPYGGRARRHAIIAAVFTTGEREAVRGRVLQLARDDPRVVAGAAVGSLASGGGDRFSDLDLTFAVVDGEAPASVLDDWSGVLVGELGAVRLFDLASGPTLYRVFLLPGCLQVDLSCTPAGSFGAVGPRWELLWGTAVARTPASAPDAQELLGYGVHHAVRARLCLERARPWQAEHWIGTVREHALALACLRLGLPTRFGRGFDDLPRAVLSPLAEARARSLVRAELLRALAAAVDGLLREAGDARELAARVEPDLRALIAADWASS